MGDLLSGTLTFTVLLGALLVLVRGMRPGGRPARSWADLSKYSDDGQPWSMALLAAFALGEVARYGTAVPAVAAVALGFWCGWFRSQGRLVSLLPGLIGAIASVLGSFTYAAGANSSQDAVYRWAVLLCLFALFALFGLARLNPLSGLTWFAALDILVFLSGPLGVTWRDIGGASGSMLGVVGIVLAVALAFMPSMMLPLAAAGVIIVQLAGAGTGYLPGDITATITMVMVTMVSFFIALAVRRRF